MSTQNKPCLSFIVATTKNWVIGRDNAMPWHLPADFAWFKENTLGKPIIMGRKTFESIGRPLPGRTNIVLSRSPFLHEGVLWQKSFDEALALLKDEKEVFLIGGGELFKQYLNKADRIYFTQIQTTLAGDTFFPELDFNQWQIKKDLFRPKDEKNPFDLRFMLLERKTSF